MQSSFNTDAIQEKGILWSLKEESKIKDVPLVALSMLFWMM